MSAAAAPLREMRVENILRSHTGVREAVAIRDPSGRVTAFVVCEDSYFDKQMGREAANAIALNKWRKVYDLSQSTKEAASAMPGFNTAGWDSSYTLKPIPDAEIREWIEASVRSILELKPKRLYEIGCGTGLLLTRIAPHCEQYVGADFSSAVLAGLRVQLQAFPQLERRVELLERQANSFDGLDRNSFDTVVLNSVVQYFPSLQYLTQVLQNAVEIVKPGGHVFVGDIRSLPLLPVFATSVELAHAEAETSVEVLRARAQRRLDRGRELVLSPAYFLHLRQWMPKISRIEIRLAPGRADNEMTRYRFQAILHIGEKQQPAADIEFMDWTPHKWGVEEIGSIIDERAGRAFGLRGIRNARVERDLIAVEILSDAAGLTTAKEVRQRAASARMEGILPEDLLDLKETRPHLAVILSWAATRDDGSFDALFVPASQQGMLQRSGVNWPQPAPRNTLRFANWPGQEKMRRNLVEQLGSLFSQHEYAKIKPDHFELVDALARGSDGDYDLAAMLAFRAD